MRRSLVVSALVLGAAWCGAKPATNPPLTGVISLEHSLNGRLHPVPVSAVKIPDGYWGARRRIVVERVLPLLRQQLEDRGAIDNFLRATGKKNAPRKGRASSDIDLYKWIEAASWAIASPDTSPVVRNTFIADIKNLVPVIAAAQDASGYLDTNFVGDRAHLRFTDLVHSHEDECLARLLFAGIAYYRATQDHALLDTGTKFADYVVSGFGPSSKPFLAAHPELVSALLELYRTGGETKYLDFARYLLTANERDRLHLKDADMHSMFSGKPFTSRTELEGQAVNALQAVSGATDFFAESGDPEYKKTLDLLWSDLVNRRLSITGGVGLRTGTDVFGEPYDVALGTPALETPVALANVAWSFRMLALTGEARYADVLERALYNEVSAAVSLSGGITCGRPYTPASAEKVKATYYETEFCPPDVSSVVESLGSYMYATGVDGVYVNLFNNSELDWHLENNTPLRLVQTTNYPWDGEVNLALHPAKPSQFSVHVRWPAWAATADVMINGNRAGGEFQRGTSIALTRTWQDGDVISVSFNAQSNVVRANPRADELYGKAAIERGPIVFALQAADQGGVPVLDSFLRAGSVGSSEFHKEAFGGVAVVKCPGFVSEKPLPAEPLYTFAKDSFVQGRKAVVLTLMPYFTIGSREPDTYETWIPVLRVPETPAPPPASNHSSGAK